MFVLVSLPLTVQFCCFQCFNSYVAKNVIQEKIQKLDTFEVQLHEFLKSIWKPAKKSLLDLTREISDGK